MLLALALIACKDADDDSPIDTGPEALTELSEEVCARSLPGPAGSGELLLALSRAHAELRLFGFTEDFVAADAALIAALADPIDLDAYAAASGACLLPAATESLGAATVESRDGVWWVVPGAGAVEVPDDGAPVAVDLRGLPWTDGLDAALQAAFAATLSTELTLPSRRVRRWDGYVDQVFSATNVYAVSTARVDGETLSAARSGGALYVLTDGALSPPAAEWAGAVALSGAGHIIGRDVLAAVAESFWSPLNERGLLWRGEVLLDEAGAWPDTIEASLETDHPESALAGLGALTTPARGDTTRGLLPARQPFQETPDPTDSEANLRASLVITHGTLRLFFPYFDVVGDEIDARLLELYAEAIDPTDRRAHVRRLGRLGEALHDGHCFFGSGAGRTWVTGYLGVALDHINGEPVVLHSIHEDLQPGDTIVAIDDVPIAEIYAELLSWHGAATEGYALDLAGRELNYLTGELRLTLRDPDGGERSVDVTPLPALDGLEYGRAQRSNDPLIEFGHPEIAYLNLNSEVTTSINEVVGVLQAAEGYVGLVLDMRDYPGVNHYEVASALMDGAYSSPIFNVPTWSGPELYSLDFDQYTFAGEGTFTGPIVLLVSPTTVSAAENFSQMLVGANRLTAIVGRNSAGTNGNITGITLPGDYYFTFTGMQLLNPDGSQFHGVGIVPTHEVVPTPANIRDGDEPEIEAAIAILTGLEENG